MLHSVSPKNMSEDEHKIGEGYKLWPNYALMALPLVVAYYGDIKWVIASSFAAALPLLNEICGRLYDLCIRVRRTNILINERVADETE